MTLKVRVFESLDLLLKFFNDTTMNGGLNANFAVLPEKITNPQYVDGLWYLFYLGGGS
mgnify:FL=1